MHDAGTVRTDSVVLERSLCFGTCPAYRLRVSRAGEVLFASRNPGEERVTAVDTVEAWVTDSLAIEADRSGFFDLPDRITAAPLCQTMRTDSPTITIGVFGPRTKRVVYYTGCNLGSDPSLASAIRALPQLAARVDSLTRAGRWIRPARLR
jgi:hypothetical protein